jgi:uncharacterized repeat protein (TIGR01451 family)
MFEKLLSQLPYNPGLAHQVSFYSRRMREEASIRRIGMVFIMLAFFVQFFAVLSPPQSSLAASSNDLVNGGISSGHDAAVACHNNTRGYGNIMAYYGIPCGDLRDAPTMNIHARDYSNSLFSLGYNPYGKPGETPVKIGGNTLYWRFLWSWPYGSQPIKVLKLVKHGVTFFVMYDCGNLVSVGIPGASPVGLGGGQPLPTPPVGVAPSQPVSKPTPAPSPTPTAAPPTPTPSPALTPTPTPCQYDSSITADNTSCKPCDKSQDGQDAASCVIIHKTATNTTQSLADANNTTAQAGDVIVYTLFAKNIGKADIKDYVFVENLSDVKDYADITNLGGGTLDATGQATWPSKDIKAGETIKQEITVKVKSPVPQTPVSASDPGHFDLIMTNVYGNTININLPGSPGKAVEAAATSLPNTGPGTSMAVGAAILIVGGYFYSRSRLLAKESNLALQESAA